MNFTYILYDIEYWTGGNFYTIDNIKDVERYKSMLLKDKLISNIIVYEKEIKVKEIDRINTEQFRLEQLENKRNLKQMLLINGFKGVLAKQLCLLFRSHDESNYHNDIVI